MSKIEDITLNNVSLVLNIASDKSFKDKLKKSINQSVKNKPKDFRRVDLDRDWETLSSAISFVFILRPHFFLNGESAHPIY